MGIGAAHSLMSMLISTKGIFGENVQRFPPQVEVLQPAVPRDHMLKEETGAVEGCFWAGAVWEPVGLGAHGSGQPHHREVTQASWGRADSIQVGMGQRWRQRRKESWKPKEKAILGSLWVKDSTPQR